MSDLQGYFTGMQFAQPMRGARFDPATLFATLMASGSGSAMAVGGTILSGLGAIQSGNAQKAASEYQAAQLDAAAKTENASAQRQAEEDRRQKEITISRARAVGAASGGGQDINLLGEIEEDGELRAMTSLWQGEEAAKGRRAQAESARFDGKQAKKSSIWKAGSTLLSGGSSFMEKYG